MMMPYWARVALGAFLGLVTAGALWLFGAAPWLTAAASALLAAIGFLGSYFVWSADRPAEGYEQVLFDRPNTLVSTFLLVAFAAAGFGTGFLGGAADPAPAASPAHVEMAGLYADYIAAADAYTQDVADGETTAAAMDELLLASDALATDIAALPEGAERTELTKANAALATAMDAMILCASGETGSCVDARLAAADASAALGRLSPAE